MKTKTKTFYTVISIVFLTVGCIPFQKAKDYRLTEEQIKWIPYQLNDTLIFKSLNEDLYDSLIVTQLDRKITNIGVETPGTRERIYCRLSGLNFTDHIIFSFGPESVKSTYFSLSMYEDKESNCRDALGAYYYPEENLIRTQLKGDNFDSGKTDKTEMINQLTINGVNYTQVIHITADENFQSPTPEFCNLGLEFYYSLNKGLIKYKLKKKEYIIFRTTTDKTYLQVKKKKGN